jgi:hypothetical protein
LVSVVVPFHKKRFFGGCDEQARCVRAGSHLLSNKEVLVRKEMKINKEEIHRIQKW